MYDLLIRNALVVDGSGREPYRSDVAIFSGIICLMDVSLKVPAREVIDAGGLVLSPGFIDLHSHGDAEAVRRPLLSEKLNQGITTEVNGNCGQGLFPVPEDQKLLNELSQDVLGRLELFSWSDYASFRSFLNERGLGINQMYYTAHTPLRLAAMGGDVKREATDEEISRMCRLLEKDLDAGSLGFSSGLYYSPCIYASGRELAALLSVVRSRKGLFAVHHRCEGDDILPSLEEVLSLSLKVGVRLEISHLKAIGERNQDKVEKALSLIEDYRDRGLDVEFDQYPYEYGSTSLFSLLPPDVQKLSRLEQRLAISLENEREEIMREMENPSGWDSIYSLVGPEKLSMLHLDSFPEYDGLSLSEIASRQAKTPLDALLDILADETGKAVMLDETESVENLERIMCHPLMHFGTDSLFSTDFPHPRTHDASMHLIREYVTNRGKLTLEEAVRKMTGFNADRLGLKDRGYVETGKVADLVLFDPVEGRVDTVIVNGKVASQKGVATGILEGRVL